MKRLLLLTLLLAGSVVIRPAENPAGVRFNSDKPLTPAEALAKFKIEPGLKIELVAAEPTVGDPVAMAFDERGRMFVAENRGYPVGPPVGEPPAGVIAMLEDPDGDGIFEKRTVFADQLTFPNGVLPWRGGLIVTCAPDILFFKDTNGDGRADLREVLFTGFATNGSTQLRVAYPTFALDNWIYVSSGLSGGVIKPLRAGRHPPVDIARGDFRFSAIDPSQFEDVDGKAQFGLSFDDAGHRFICMNRVHVEQVVLPSRYLKRNPHLAFSETVEKLPESMLPDLLRGRGVAARIYPISSNITTADSHAGTFTAACGLLIYGGDALPEDFQGNAFACDPTGNLVHRDKLVSRGATFTARPARAGREMLASPDNWFRPVYLATGPDGALYVCDMYRKTIEHPDYLPEEIRKRTDFQSGRGMGRIYRITAAKAERAPARAFDLTRSSAAELCELLSSKNSWWRLTAQRLLLERGDRSAINILQQRLARGGGGEELFHVHALRVLDGFNALDEGSIVRALKSPASIVREEGLDLSEEFLKAPTPKLVESILAMADDRDARVRFRAAIEFGEVKDPRMVAGLARVLEHDAGDRWTRAAALSSCGGHALELMAELRQKSPGFADRAGHLALMMDLGRLVASSQSTDELVGIWRELIAQQADAMLGTSALAGFVEGLRARGFGAKKAAIRELPGWNSTDDAQFGHVLESAQQIARASDVPLFARTAALAVIGQGDFESVGDALMRFLAPGEPVELQIGAVRALGASRRSAAALLEKTRWIGFTPPLREIVLETLLSRPATTRVLLETIQRGELSPWILPPARRESLQRHADLDVRGLARDVFRKVQSSERMAVFEEYKPVLKLGADARNGQPVFKRVCAGCHQLDREGIPVGPDLLGIRTQTKEAILLHILVPEFEILPGYTNYLIETKDGRSFSGLIGSETPSSVTLRAANGLEETFLRKDIAQMAASQFSLMPEELEKTMTRQELADLLAYLKGE